MSPQSASAPSPSTTGMLISRLVSNASVVALGLGSHYRVIRMALQEGVELIHWQGHFEQPLDIPLQDDSNRVSFSFNCGLDGAATCQFGECESNQYAIEANVGNIHYGQGRRGRYRQQGTLENLSVLVHPDVMRSWVEQSDDGLRHMLASGGFAAGHRGGELIAAAQWINRHLKEAQSEFTGQVLRHPLWFQGQAITLVSLFLAARLESRIPRATTSRDARLLRARDHLLSNLSRPPSLAELAQTACMSEPTLTRGFRSLFGTSPFELFQRERMQSAHAQLLNRRSNIGAIAAAMGYTNLSHFAAAFRKQFGVNPSEIRRRSEEVGSMSGEDRL